MNKATWNIRKSFWVVILNWIIELLIRPQLYIKKLLKSEGDEQSFEVKCKFPNEHWDFDESDNEPMFI